MQLKINFTFNLKSPVSLLLEDNTHGNLQEKYNENNALQLDYDHVDATIDAIACK